MKTGRNTFIGWTRQRLQILFTNVLDRKTAYNLLAAHVYEVHPKDVTELQRARVRRALALWMTGVSQETIKMLLKQ